MPPAATADQPRDRAFHPYPWWSPRFWHGMPLGVWLPLVAEHRARASLSKWGLMATVSLAAGFNSLGGVLSEARFRGRLRHRPDTPAPLFIIGHWRSGTTLLHELAMLDDRFCCPNTYQCLAPGHFLLTEDTLTSALSWIMPAKRPMDDVAAGFDRPQEDEFALMNMGAPSPYRRMAFPLTSRDAPESLDLTLLPAAERERWQGCLRRFLDMLALRDPRRPVLKSPPHTARVGVLAGMFPEARFLHVVRDPFVVVPSTLRLWRSLHEVQGLQVDRGEALERYVFAAFAEMYDAFERDRPALALPIAQSIVDVMTTFGWRQSRQSPATERDDAASAMQTLILANGVLGTRMARLSDDSWFTEMALGERPVSALVDETFMRVLSRAPLAEEKAQFSRLLEPVYAGRVVEFGSVVDVFREPLHPYTKGLFASMPVLGDERKRLATIPGNVPNPARLPKGCPFNPRCAEMNNDAKCASDDPPLLEVREKHWAACWHTPGYAQGKATVPDLAFRRETAKV